VTAQPQPGGMRYRLLEPVRQYAQGRLMERGGWEATRRQHADYFLTLAKRGEDGLQGVDRMPGWLASSWPPLRLACLLLE
jgi:predicted ATPase